MPIALDGFEFWVEDSGGRQLPSSDAIVDNTGKILAEIEIERNTYYCVRFRTAEEKPLNALYELFTPWSNGQDTRATVGYMKKGNPRTQHSTSKDKLDPPFTQYQMLQSDIQNYVRLEIRRFQGEVESQTSADATQFYVDLVDDPAAGSAPYLTLEYRFKMPDISAGRKKRARNSSREEDDDEQGPSTRPVKRVRGTGTSQDKADRSDSEDDEDPATLLRKMEDTLISAKREELEAKSALREKLDTLRAEIVATKKRTADLKKLL
ncbi:hypothetical protein DFH09DRAFT_1353461 [Mycena vulgaris]|nr:hypothetical protein DFH09DRAFT_1353461 [Mycena vulgaris]